MELKLMRLIVPVRHVQIIPSIGSWKDHPIARVYPAGVALT